MSAHALAFNEDVPFSLTVSDVWWHSVTGQVTSPIGDERAVMLLSTPKAPFCGCIKHECLFVRTDSRKPNLLHRRWQNQGRVAVWLLLDYYGSSVKDSWLHIGPKCRVRAVFDSCWIWYCFFIFIHVHNFPDHNEDAEDANSAGAVGAPRSGSHYRDCRYPVHALR